MDAVCNRLGVSEGMLAYCTEGQPLLLQSVLAVFTFSSVVHSCRVPT